MTLRHRRHTWIRRAGLAGLGLLCALPLMAQTLTDTFVVRMEIQGSCVVMNASDIDFGTGAAMPGQKEMSGTIRLQCTKDLPFTVGLDGGRTTGDVNARAMEGADGVRIPYTLSRDSATGPNWGNDSSSAASGVGAGLGSAHEIALTVHAKVDVNGDEPAGQYADTVTVTLSY